MALPQWTNVSGVVYNLGVTSIEERTTVSIALPLASTEGVTVTHIAGTLPPGLRIEDYKIVGVPFEVNRSRDFEFTIRASTNEGIADRTFVLTVEGLDAPQWETPEGLLAVGVQPSGQYWFDHLNTKWGLYATNGGSTFVEQSVTVYEGIPSSSEGDNGDFGFVLEQNYFYFKANNRWHKFTRTNLQRELGSDQDLFVGSTVPNPNIIDFWFNTNKLNTGFDAKLKRYDANIPSWLPVTYTIGATAPVTPGDGAIWIQTFESTINFVIKKFNGSENLWEVLKYEYGSIPPERKNRAYFILDNSLVDFQLQAIDTDLSTGENLKYYIGDNGGELPPGLSLSEDGRITGIVDPILALDQYVEPGYDIGRYDTGLFDFGLRDDYGYDSYYYDTAYYGYSIRTKRPKKLNRRYQFVVTVADEVSESKREFGIYVVGDDFVRADNTIMQAGTGIFTADNTYLRNPLWLTPGDFGYRRAHNYVTLYLDVYDPNTLIGNISYILKDTNDDGTPSTLPPGLALDTITGEIAGRVPYQPAVSKEYRFTVEALRQEGDYDVQDDFITTIYEDTLPGRTEVKTFKQDSTLTGSDRDVSTLSGKSILIDQNSYTVSSVDKSNRNYDLIKIDRPLEPIANVKPIKIIQNSTLTNTWFYASYDSFNTTAQQTFWRGKTLTYSSTEAYKITDIQEYVSLTVQNESGNTMPLEFNYDAAASVISPPVTPETPAEALQRYIAAQISLLGANPDIYNLDITSSGGGSMINVIVPAFPTTRNRNLIKSLFHFDDSSGVDVIYGNSNISDANLFRVVVNTGLTRVLNKNNQISMGALKDTTIRQRITVANVETVSAIKTFTVRMLGEVESTISWITPTTLPDMVANRTSYLRLEAETSVVGANLKYNLISGSLPYGLELKSDGEVVGRPNQFPSVQVKYKGIYKNDRTYYYNDLVRDGINYYRCIKNYTAGIYYPLSDTDYWQEFTINETDKGLTFIDRQFNPWISGYSYNIGDVVEFAEVKYKCVQAHTSTTSSGDANRPDYDTSNTYWSSTDVLTEFDGGTTTFNRTFEFTVLVRDRFGFSASARTFTVNLIDIDSKVYSNIYMQPYIKMSQRDVFNSFINNNTIFSPSYIYRPSDPNFGIQKSLRTLAYAGIEQKQIDSFVAAAALNHKKKRFKFGELKTAVARQPGTNDVIYEVVYIDIIDPYEPTNGKTRTSFKINTTAPLTIDQVKLEIKDDNSAQEAGLDFYSIQTRTGIVQIRADSNQVPIYTRTSVVNISATGNIQIVGNDGSVTVIVSQSSLTSSSEAPFRFRPNSPVITADSNAYKVSQNKDNIRYISNISNMRQRLSEIGASERQYLPLWMRTSQGTDIQELDYITAMPICYCKPGTGELIKENIINANFDFSQIDYEIDRYIVDSTIDNQNEQFVLFANYKFNV